MSEGTHPRPQLMRESWESLDGIWAFAFTEAEEPTRVSWKKEICVPFPPEAPLSGVGDSAYHPVVWYRRTFQVPRAWKKGKILLHFGAVDYSAKVWVNKQLVSVHEGGHTPFTADITELLTKEGEQEVIVRAEDDPLAMDQPRGKQDWELEPHHIWYPRTTGIWQPVWLESVPPTYIGRVHFTPNLSEFGILTEVLIEGEAQNHTLEAVFSLDGALVAKESWHLVDNEIKRWVHFQDPGVYRARERFLWSPERPTLIQVNLRLKSKGRVIDEVNSYTALRAVEARDGAFYLNGRPYFLRLVLDQGYWPEGHLAAPNSEALKSDVKLAKAFGFNGVRKHQKIEDPRYLYWADRLGLVVWEEMPSAYCFTRQTIGRLVREWMEAIDRDYNHPSVVVWVPFNESWGVSDLLSSAPQRELVQAIYNLTKALDPTRPVVDNDGWEHQKTDIFTIHDYLNDPELFRRKYETREALQETLSSYSQKHKLALFEPQGNPPVILSEFGGIKLGGTGWGYQEVSSPEELLKSLEALFAVICDSALAGFCYTQLYDTFQEKNGLCYANRQPKVDPKLVARILRECEKKFRNRR